MASRLNRFVLVTITGVLASLGACDCGTDPPPAGVARIIARFPAGSSVQSDGASVLQVSLTATTAEGSPDTAPISIEAASGGVALRDGTDFATGLNQAPNSDGVLDLDFRCDFRASGAVALSVTNGTVDTTVTVRCIEPRGDIVIAVDDSACQGFAADGESTCQVDVTVEQRGSVTIPLPGALEVKVLQATPLDAGDAAATRVLSSDGLGSPASEVSVTIGDDGQGHYFLHAPTIAETVQVELVSSGVTIEREHGIGAFVNQAAVRLTSNSITVAGGNSRAVEIQVVNPRGAPADTASDVDDILDIRIDGGDEATRPQLSAGGQGPGQELTAVNVSAGAVELTVSTVAVTASQTYTVTITYQPLRSLDPIQQQLGVTVNPPGTLLLELGASPTTIHSDSLTPSDLVVDVDVALTVDGAAATGGSVVLTIPSDSTARIAFIGSDGVTENPEDDARSYTVTTAALGSTGSATVQVAVTPNVPTGIARIVAIGRATGGNPVQQEVVLNVERAPILQAIVFDAATPDVIGVQGGSLASSSAVSFILLDDAGRVMPNVGVTFTSNATADRGITVTANAVSDSAGKVVTVLSAGTIPGPVTVRVSAESGLIGAGGSPILRTSQSNPIPIVGGLPSFETSHFRCGAGTAAAAESPYSVTCEATLVDKFSNVVPDLRVQFSAEAAAEQASVSAGSGVATVEIASTAELRPTSDVLGWSYGIAIPNLASDLVGSTFTLADAQACFDNLLSTPCDLIKLCDDSSANSAAYCPLPDNGGACLAAGDIAAGVAAASALLDDGTLTPLAAATTRAAEIAAYVDDHRGCGFPVSCLRGRQWGLGLDVVAGDHCPVNPGCLDFSAGTECPQDSVRTLIASVRGAEAYSDFNGNSVFDFDDSNGNGVHDAGEAVLGDAFVDMPEPYLDRNDNCFRDDLTDNARFLYRPIEMVRHTDQFSDVNGDGNFGFDGQERSGAWDFDTQIFLTEKLLEIYGTHLEVGEACNNPGGAHTCAAGGTRPCVEIATGETFARGCGIPDLTNNTTAFPGAVRSHTIAYRWSDANGNCPSVDFAQTSNATVTGFVTVGGSTAVDLDDDLCGFVQSFNPMLPHCTSVPFSASPLLLLTISENCAQASDPVNQISVDFTLGADAVDFATSLLCQ